MDERKPIRMPTGLSEEAKDYWRRNAPLCITMGTLREQDRDTFTLLAMAWSRMIQADKANEAHSFICASKQVQNLTKLFGLDPMSRKKLGINIDPIEKDEFGL